MKVHIFHDSVKSDSNSYGKPENEVVIMNRKTKALEFVDEGYNLQITGRHIEITDAMREYVKEKVLKLERLAHNIIDVNIIMSVQKTEHRAEIILKFSHFKVTSQASCDEMYPAIDKAFARLEERLRRYKTRIQNHHIKSFNETNLGVEVIKRPEQIDEEELRPNAPKIVKQDTIALKTLSYEEALMEMELSYEDPFLFFIDATHKTIKCIYRRPDGDYGIIEPKF